MENRDFIVRTWPFLLVAFGYILLGLSLHKYYEMEELHLMFNSWNSEFGDIFFRYFTKTGELFFGLLVLLFLVLKKTWRWVLMFLSAAILQVLVVQGMKRGFYVDHLRPAFYFKEKGIDLHLVDGFTQSITYTYPSGHTATAFFVFLFLAVVIKNRWAQAFFAVMAGFTAYSRIYLSQHFMLDTVAGALIGVFCTIVCYYFWLNNNSPFLNKKVIK